MRTILTAINAKFIHTSLSVRYLANYCKDILHDVEIAEFTINHRSDYILQELFELRPDVLCFQYIYGMSI